MSQRVALFLRTKPGVNDFRRILRSFLAIPTLSSATVTSGFFQEDSKFSASDLFVQPCIKRATPARITFVGVYNGLWVPSFTKFGSSLWSKLSCSCCTTIGFKKPGGAKWHAKVFIGSVRGKPRFGIIGSSNLTRPAADLTSPFNYEADAVAWYESDREVDGAVREGLGEVTPGRLLLTRYSPRDRLNGGVSLEHHLAILEDRILNAGQ